MNAFKAFRIHEREGKIAAGFEQLAIDALTAGDVVVRVKYSSINYKDALAATGKGRIIRRFPCVGGIDAGRHGGGVDRFALRAGGPGYCAESRLRRVAARWLCAARPRARRLGHAYP